MSSGKLRVYYQGDAKGKELKAALIRNYTDFPHPNTKDIFFLDFDTELLYQGVPELSENKLLYHPSIISASIQIVAAPPGSPGGGQCSLIGDYKDDNIIVNYSGTKRVATIWAKNPIIALKAWQRRYARSNGFRELGARIQGYMEEIIPWEPMSWE